MLSSRQEHIKKTDGEHIDNNFDHQIKLFTIIVSALGIIYGIIFAYEQAHDLFLLIPVIIFPLGLRAQHATYAIDEIGKYLEQLEIQIRGTMSKTSHKNWEGWQNYWVTHKKETKILLYDVLPKWLLFIAISMSVSVIYSNLIITKYIPLEGTMLTSYLSDDFHLFLSGIYILVMGSTLIYFIFYKKIYKSILSC